VVGDDHVRGVRGLRGEVALQREVALLGGKVVGERADPCRADAESEGGQRGGDERAGGQGEAQRWAA
jgi:hypothetical protein